MPGEGGQHPLSTGGVQIKASTRQQSLPTARQWHHPMLVSVERDRLTQASLGGNLEWSRKSFSSFLNTPPHKYHMI